MKRFFIISALIISTVFGSYSQSKRPRVIKDCTEIVETDVCVKKGSVVFNCEDCLWMASRVVKCIKIFDSISQKENLDDDDIELFLSNSRKTRALLETWYPECRIHYILEPKHGIKWQVLRIDLLLTARDAQKKCHIIGESLEDVY